MGARSFTPGRIHDLPLTRRSVVAVDLGFGASKTCGIAHIRHNDRPPAIVTSFGGCVRHIARLVTNGEIDSLIVEAPLSGVFSSNGDPQWRQPFERQPGKDKLERRYWYTQPGSTVCLAAVAFFSRLASEIGEQVQTVSVFEGFFTFKPKGKSDHLGDAINLVNAATDSSLGIYYEVSAPANGQILSVLSLVGADSSEAPPAIVACKSPQRLSEQVTEAKGQTAQLKNGVPVFPPTTGKVVDSDMVRELDDEPL